jgi:hypothetical protein
VLVRRVGVSKELLTYSAVSVASDGFLYFTDNQLAFSKAFSPGTDRRQRPFVLFRVKLPGNGTRVDLQ